MKIPPSLEEYVKGKIYTISVACYAETGGHLCTKYIAYDREGYRIDFDKMPIGTSRIMVRPIEMEEFVKNSPNFGGTL